MHCYGPYLHPAKLTDFNYDACDNGLTIDFFNKVPLPLCKKFFMKLFRPGKIRFPLLVTVICLAFAFRKDVPAVSDPLIPRDTLLYPAEKHFSNVQQLTNG